MCKYSEGPLAVELKSVRRIIIFLVTFLFEY